MIVPVDVDNAAAWAALCVAMWQEDDSESLLKQWRIGQFPHEFLYVDDENEQAPPLGFISLSIRTDYVEGTDTRPVAYLEGIYVLPAHRRQGLARRMIAFARTWARQQGCTQLASDCELCNTESQALHRALGFSQVNIVVCYIAEIADA